MAKTFRVEKVRAGRPIPVFVTEHAVENENLLSIGMIVRWESRARLIADDGGNLPRFWRTH